MSLRWVVCTCVFVGCGGAVIAEPEARTTATATPTPTPTATATATAHLLRSLSASGGQSSEPATADAEVRQVSARHILVRVGNFPDGKQRTLKQAHAVIAEAQRRFAAGEDFAALAREYSEDPGTAKRGGDLGPFRRGEMVKEFDDAVFALAPYEATVVETVFGVHLVQRTR